MERTLEAIGEEIERIDDWLVTILAERFRLAGEAGEVKKATGLAITRPAVEQARISRVVALAEAQGLPTEFVRELMEKIVRQCRTIQEPARRPWSGWGACQ